MNRMLARFGLPHLRARKVRFYLNGNLMGLYTLMEAIDAEYVFARSFPDYNPFNFSLFKWKIEAIGCGRYDPDLLADAAIRMNDPNKPPWSFEPGPHRIPPPVYGKARFPLCMEAFVRHHFGEDKRDVAALYLQYGENCGEMLVEEGLMDRKAGTKNWDVVMKNYINKYLTEKVVDGNSEMDEDVDLESYLKTVAFYAVAISQDSPLGSQNNYYMAQTGDGKGFKLVAYDHNNGPGNACDCGDHMIHWSIARPTCLGIEYNHVVGPLLLKPELHQRYLGYVRDFVEQVASQQDLIDEILEHARAIYPFVADDFWYVGGNYELQFSTDPEDWNGDFRQPLVPFLIGRVQDVRDQLAAMDAGTYPRGPHQEIKEDIYEECVDWRSHQAADVACPNNCLYEGCYQNYWQMSHHCLEDSGTCVHGTYDDRCRGVVEGGQYPGMESPRETTGLETFCLDSWSLFPIKASVCPPPPKNKANDGEE